jgi:hypothetical protein
MSKNGASMSTCQLRNDGLLTLGARVTLSDQRDHREQLVVAVPCAQ